MSLAVRLVGLRLVAVVDLEMGQVGASVLAQENFAVVALERLSPLAEWVRRSRSRYPCSEAVVVVKSRLVAQSQAQVLRAVLVVVLTCLSLLVVASVMAAVMISGERPVK
jgi:hypothetical protein